MIRYFRFLSGRERTHEANRHLGLTLAFVAGAVNSGGFLAVSQFTSHMTGILSLIGEHLALREPTLVLAGLGIELGKLFYWNVEGTGRDKVTANREKLSLHASMIGSFVAGGFGGALGFKRLGFGVTLPIAALLMVVAVVPVWDDLSAR